MNELKNSSFSYKFNLPNVFSHLVSYLYNLTSCQSIELQRLYVFPSAKCNDLCVYCIKKENSCSPEIFENRLVIDRLVSDIHELRIKEINLFGGGEPFFYKDNMFYFLEKMKTNDTYIKIITNGNNLNDEDIQRIVQDGLVSHLCLNMNTDSPEMAGNVYLDGKRHDRTIDILKSISKYKKIYNKQSPSVDIFFVLFNMNYNKIPNIISLFKDLGISFFFIQPLRILSPLHDNLKLSQEQMNEFEQMLPSIERIMKDAKIDSNIDDFKINKNLIEDSKNLKCAIPNRTLAGKSKLACFLPLTTLAICSDGTISRCLYIDKPYASNYFSLPSLKSFIQGGELVDFSKGFIEAEGSSLCHKCTLCILYEVEEIRRRLLNFKQIDTDI